MKTILTFLFIFLLSVSLAFSQRITVAAGAGTLDAALAAATAGDTLELAAGGTYQILENLVIDKEIILIADVISTLPGLEGMPKIENLFQVSPVFKLKDGCNLSLIGIDVDAQGGAYIFNAQGDTGKILDIYINRCRLHNTSDNVFHQAVDLNAQEIQLRNCVVKNSFIYDSGEGHGFYTKSYESGGTNEYVFENITFWNLGQQLNWMRNYPESVTQKITYNHMTGYNLSTSTGENKEIMGNSDAEGEAVLDITVKNSIFHTQVSTNEGSFKFDNTSGRHTISINNNVLFQLQPIVDLGGTIEKASNQEVDPQFADPANGDFTVGNTSLYEAAADGKIIGALYWHPDFVDEMCDVNPAGCEDNPESINYSELNSFSVKVYPNPVQNDVMFSFNLNNVSNVSLIIYSIDGRMVKTLTYTDLPSGEQNISVNTQQLLSGVYYYTFSANNRVSQGVLTKLK